MKPREPIPALVLGSGVTALGVIRVLSRRGIPSLSLSGGSGPERRSRWFKPAPDLKPASEEGPGAGDPSVELTDYLQGGPLNRAVLFPCSDETVLEVAGLDTKLSERFPAFVPPLPALETFIDKGRFLDVLVSEEVPHPATHLEVDAGELAALFRATDGPLFLKPRHSHLLQRKLGVKALRSESLEGLQSAADTLLGHGIDFVVQEYVPGPASNHYFLDGFVGPKGTVLATFGRQRLRMYPLDFGNSSLMVSVPLDEVREAADHLHRLLARLDYQGIFSAEFKLDPRDGVFRILEVNARPWWYIEFAARCGVDVASLSYRAALGEPIGPVESYRSGKRLSYPYYDFFACFSESTSFPVAMARFLGPLMTAQQPVFTWDDPWPGIAAAGRTAGGFLRRRLSGRKRNA
jgi:predicted ATP-grasp superfamily ATP-dependent carboligase